MELTIIPAYKKQFIRAAIYARVSTSGRKQLESLSAQVSALTKYVYSKPGWDLWDVYMEVGSSKTGSTRKEFDRLVSDCQKRKIDYVLVKSVERFGRDTKEVIGAVREIRQAGANVLFFSEGIDTGPMMFEMELTLAAAIAQADNESRSKNIRMGLIYGAENGTSGLYRRKYYGYGDRISLQKSFLDMTDSLPKQQGRYRWSSLITYLVRWNLQVQMSRLSFFLYR